MEELVNPDYTEYWNSSILEQLKQAVLVLRDTPEKVFNQDTAFTRKVKGHMTKYLSNHVLDQKDKEVREALKNLTPDDFPGLLAVYKDFTIDNNALSYIFNEYQKYKTNIYETIKMMQKAKAEGNKRLVEQGFFGENVAKLYIVLAKNIGETKENGYLVDFFTDINSIEQILGVGAEDSIQLYQNFDYCPYLIAKMHREGKVAETAYLIPCDSLTSSLQYEEVRDLYYSVDTDAIIEKAGRLIDEVTNSPVH